MVETYAVASYGEVNPAVFTIVTFPFLFGLMFGDVGHGLMLLLATLAIIAFEGRLGRMSKVLQKQRKSGEVINSFTGRARTVWDAVSRKVSK